MSSNTANERMIPLLLPVSAVNVILSGLAELPYKVSYLTLESVKRQADAEMLRQQEFLAASQAQDQVGGLTPEVPHPTNL